MMTMMTEEMLRNLEQGLVELRQKLAEAEAAVLRQEGAVLLARQLLAAQKQEPEGNDDPQPA